MGQLVGAFQDGREKRRGEQGDSKGELTETEAEKKIRERVGRAKG